MRLISALVLGLLATPAHGPASYGPPADKLKLKLRALVTAQEEFWVTHGTYTTDVSALGMFPSAPTTDSVWVQVIQAGGRSWWGRAAIHGHNGRSCIIYVGSFDDFTAPPTTDSLRMKAEHEGEPVCDVF